jgi:hypothetical protein
MFRQTDLLRGGPRKVAAVQRNLPWGASLCEQLLPEPVLGLPVKDGDKPPINGCDDLEIEEDGRLVDDTYVHMSDEGSLFRCCQMRTVLCSAVSSK